MNTLLAQMSCKQSANGCMVAMQYNANTNTQHTNTIQIMQKCISISYFVCLFYCKKMQKRICVFKLFPHSAYFPAGQQCTWSDAYNEVGCSKSAVKLSQFLTHQPTPHLVANHSKTELFLASQDALEVMYVSQ